MSPILQNGEMSQKLQVNEGIIEGILGFEVFLGIPTSPQQALTRRTVVLVLGHLKRNNGISVSKGRKGGAVPNLLRQ